MQWRATSMHHLRLLCRCWGWPGAAATELRATARAERCPRLLRLPYTPLDPAQNQPQTTTSTHRGPWSWTHPPCPSHLPPRLARLAPSLPRPRVGILFWGGGVLCGAVRCGTALHCWDQGLGRRAGLPAPMGSALPLPTCPGRPPKEPPTPPHPTPRLPGAHVDLARLEGLLGGAELPSEDEEDEDYKWGPPFWGRGLLGQAGLLQSSSSSTTAHTQTGPHSRGRLSGSDGEGGTGSDASGGSDGGGGEGGSEDRSEGPPGGSGSESDSESGAATRGLRCAVGGGRAALPACLDCILPPPPCRQRCQPGKRGSGGGD